jgi:hypothetical protein
MPRFQLDDFVDQEKRIAVRQDLFDLRASPRQRLRCRHQDDRALPGRPSELTGRAKTDSNTDVIGTAIGTGGLV